MLALTYPVDNGGSFVCFNDTATTEIYTLSRHDALPICRLVADTHLSRLRSRAAPRDGESLRRRGRRDLRRLQTLRLGAGDLRSEEHTSELPPRQIPLCRLLLEKKIRDVREIPGRTGVLG